MIHPDKPFRLCWTTEQARSVFRTEALEGDDAVFLATHTPISGFEIAGRDAQQFKSKNEESVLETLSEASRRHAFCVVQGEPGSGKSHLIRWLAVNWTGENDLKLLLRRADGSLEGALSQLSQRLPDEFQELFEGLGVRQKASTQGRANNFLSTLTNALDPEHYDEKLGDEEWCATHDPSSLLRHEYVRKGWHAPLRILTLLEGGDGERNSASASFNLYDIADLGPIARRVKLMLEGPGKDLARRIEQEATKIEEYREAKWTPLELASEKSVEFPISTEFLEVLNRRRNDSIQSVIGVSAQGLKVLFRKVRQELQKRGQRLVLLLEDITSWEGLDDSLIDVLVFNAEARGNEAEADVCPLISIVGVTPAYYQQLKPNYRQRITHEVILGTSNGDLQDVAMLRQSGERTAFVSRYLAAVRVGPAALASWRQELTTASDVQVPNVCIACEKQESCFSVFGSCNGVGLFPFTENSIGRFFEALKVDDNGQSWRTPRGILQAVLNPVLQQADDIIGGQFPGTLIETIAIENNKKSDNVLSARLERVIEAQIDEAERDRFKRFVAYWGNPDSADHAKIDGEIAFAGAKRSQYEAFTLPWVDGDAERITHSDTSKSKESREAALRKTDIRIASPIVFEPGTAESEQKTELRVKDVSAPQAASPKVQRPPRARSQTRSQRETMRDDLRNWAKSGSLSNSSAWNDELYSLISRIDARKLGVSPYLFKRVVTPEMVSLEGTKAGKRGYFIVEAKDWVRLGLEAGLELQSQSEMSSDDRAFFLRNLSIMMSRLEEETKRYLKTRLPVTVSGDIWSPVSSVSQVLLARSWLRGVLSPEVPLVEQIRHVLSDELAPTSDPSSRSKPWQRWLEKTDPWQDKLREELRALITLSEDGRKGMIASGELVAAITRMNASGRMDELPEFEGKLSGTLTPIGAAYDLAGEWNSECSKLLSTEFKQIRDRCEALSGTLRGRSISEHLKRADQVISSVSDLLPGKSHDLVSEWKLDYHRAKTAPPDFVSLQQVIVALEDEALQPGELPQKLSWLASRPAKDLQEINGLAQLGERTISALLEHARDTVGESNEGQSLSYLKEIGKKLVSASGDGR